MTTSEISQLVNGIIYQKTVVGYESHSHFNPKHTAFFSYFALPHWPLPPKMMNYFSFHLSVFYALLMFLGGASGGLEEERMFTKKIKVDPSGDGICNPSTIKSAIDSVPQNNNKWVHIFVKAGDYR